MSNPLKSVLSASLFALTIASPIFTTENASDTAAKPTAPIAATASNPAVQRPPTVMSIKGIRGSRAGQASAERPVTDPTMGNVANGSNIESTAKLTPARTMGRKGCTI